MRELNVNKKLNTKFNTKPNPHNNITNAKDKGTKSKREYLL